MKKILLSTLLPLSLFATNEAALLKDSKDKSLIAFEGGYANIALNKTTTPNKDLSTQPLYGAFKIGAQSEHYRLYFSANYFHVKEYDYANSLGAEFHYLQPLNNTFGLFFGLNSSLINLRADSDEGKREFSTLAIGGDVGLDVDISKLITFQFATRYTPINVVNTRLNTTKTQEINYSLDSMLNLYMTLAFKFNLN